MPFEMSVPFWYSDENYINEKVTECNTTKFGQVEGQEWKEWTPDSVRAFLAQANGATAYAPWMGYENFVNFGNAANVSPNPLFNVMEYCAAKANQLNAMNDGLGYEGNSAWTAVTVLEYFKAHNISAWDHFTQFGQFEGVNPSNAMDLSEFLANKAAQCNSMAYAGKTDWTADSVLQYYRDNGLNAVEVAGSASDPNVEPVTGSEVVNPPLGYTPWGVSATPVDATLTPGQDIFPASTAPLSFVGTVGSKADTTLNADDQITGGNKDDSLTVNMTTDFDGLNKQGFVRDVPTVNVNNTTENGADLAFNAAGITGVQTWNVQGNVNLENIGQTGITINYKDVNYNDLSLSFADGVTKGANDSLTIGVDNVNRIQNFQSKGIENVTVNATGDYSYILVFMEDMNNMNVTGDANLGVRGGAVTLKTVDMSEATGNVAICCRTADLFESIVGGSGNDAISLQSVIPNAVIQGGEGSDRVNLVNTPEGAYKFQMDSVETIAIRTSNNLELMDKATTANATNMLALDGSDTTGLETLILAGGNGWDFINEDGTLKTDGQALPQARDIILTNYDIDQLKIDATGHNNVDLTIDTVEDVTMNVTGAQALLGSVTLVDAGTVAINTLSGNNSDFTFSAVLNAENATSLALNAASGAKLEIQRGDLSDVGEITVSGYSNVEIDGDTLLANDVSTVFANSVGLISGGFRASFVDNSTTGGATLNITGSATAGFDIYTDETYTKINVTGGLQDDVLNIDATKATAENKIVVTGDLGMGDNMIIITGDRANVDLDGLAEGYRVVTQGVPETPADPDPAA